MPRTVISRINKHFPKVTNVVDATDTIEVSVKPEDVRGATKKDPGSCALARACIRDKKADGAMINLAYSYIIKGKTATRYKTSVAVGRELTSFDRHADFATGKHYKLSKVSVASRLGPKPRKPHGRHGHHKSSMHPPVVHHTVRVRTTKKD